MNPVSRFIRKFQRIFWKSHKLKTDELYTFGGSPVGRQRSKPAFRPAPVAQGSGGITWKVGDKAEHKKWGIGDSC